MASEPEGNLERPRFSPSDHLTAMFKACAKDPAEVIQTRLKRMLDTFLQHCRGKAEDEKTKELADKCYHQAGICYYKILEKLAIEDSNRLGISDVSPFFFSDLPQSCLVACCLEITMSSEKPPCKFPLLLQIFDLAPYHFANVIEPVIRAGENLPEVAKKHLCCVRDEILESLAWTSDSPLWEEIKANGGQLLPFKQVVPPHRLEYPRENDVQPENNLPGGLMPANPDQQLSDSAEIGPQRNKSFSFFLRQVYKLADFRLRTQYVTLHIPNELQRKIWTCFEHSLVKFPDLMKDRHLDQLLMCAIYIIAKTTKEEIPFKRIVRCYKSQLSISESVCKDVLISGEVMGDSLPGDNNEENNAAFPTPDTPSAHYPGPREEQRGNLFDFFNQVYSPKMSDFAQQFAVPIGIGSPPLTPYPKPTPRRLSNKYNIFISPLERGMTPQQSSGLTNTSFSTSEKSNSLVAGDRIPNKRSCVALSLETEEGDENDGPPPRRHCTNSQTALQRRLTQLESDRAAGKDQAKPTEGPQPDLHSG